MIFLNVSIQLLSCDLFSTISSFQPRWLLLVPKIILSLIELAKSYPDDFTSLQLKDSFIFTLIICEQMKDLAM